VCVLWGLVGFSAPQGIVTRDLIPLAGWVKGYPQCQYLPASDFFALGAEYDRVGGGGGGGGAEGVHIGSDRTDADCGASCDEF